MAKIKPMLSYLVDEPFDNEDWLFETKWDGFRAIAEVKKKKVELYSRTFQPFNHRFPTVVEALQQLNVDAIFDGEVVVVDKKGNSSFQALQNAQNSPEGVVSYAIFDLLFLEGKDLRKLPLLERKKKLKEVLKNSKSPLLIYSDHLIGEGKKLFKLAEKKDWEGIMAKACDSPYLSTRSRSWLKIKTHKRQEAVICGFTEPKGGREHFGALVLGIYEKGQFRYAGLVGTGFNRASLRDVMRKLEPLVTNKCPLISPPKGVKATWVQPKILCEISFAEWTKDGSMRHPVFLGTREDKKAEEVRKETPLFTHVDKVFWPKEGYTKGDLLSYYDSVSKYILPYLKNRPESLRRYPNGIEEESFFQKNIVKGVPDWVETVKVQHSDKVVNYLLVQDKKSLLFAVNFGCIDFNPFNSNIKSLDNPDYLILDLDPEDISFGAVVETAQMLHELLEEMLIPSYPKTSGATGIHIYIPLAAKYSYNEAKQFAEILARKGHERLPTITSVERLPKKRQKKVYIDFLQNNFGQTLAAPYSVRPRPGASVSTPLLWSEVKKGLDPLDFNIKNTLKRLEKKGDLFLPVLGKGINIQKILSKHP